MAAPHVQAVHKFAQSCPNCKVPTTMVEDHAAGDLICQECGLVVESHGIEETSEWRTILDSDKKGGPDPNRVSGPTNPLLASGGLGTQVGRTGPDGSALGAQLSRLQNRAANPERRLLAAFSAIGGLADRLGLSSRQRDTANEIFKKVSERQLVHGRRLDSIYAACVFIACKLENRQHTFREICGAMRGTNVKDIGRAYRFIVTELKELSGATLAAAQAHPKFLVGNFTNRMGIMDRNLVRGATQILEAFVIAREKDASATSIKTPATIAAAGIYLALMLSDGRVVSDAAYRREQLQKLSLASGMQAATVATAFREDIYPRRREICPAWFASADQVSELPLLHGGGGSAKPAALPPSGKAALPGPSK